MWGGGYVSLHGWIAGSQKGYDEMEVVALIVMLSRQATSNNLSSQIGFRRTSGLE
jgi:hypothetical protein